MIARGTLSICLATWLSIKVAIAVLSADNVSA